MERNLKPLYVCVFVMVAALVGCGGGNNSTSNDTTGGSAGSSNSGGSAGSELDGDVCAKSLGGTCDEEGAVDPCTDYVCACGQWQDPDNIQCPDAGTDAEPDANDPDSGVDAESDVDQPDAPPSPEEICGNDKDDDGNGKADCQDDACSSELECQEEVCDGVDNNGNGQEDEGFTCKLGSTGNCQTACGSFGTMECESGCEWGACQPPAENCTNGKDDNCNGKTDCEDSSCAGHAVCQCDAPTVGEWCNTPYVPGDFFECEPSLRCDCSFKWDYAATGDYSCQTEEVCNGFDDNGNTVVDEGFACIKNSKQECNTSCGSVGQQTCDSTCNWGTCQPPVENCFSGSDEDCDGDVDCDDSDCSSLQACQEEVCDGLDNNGNGQTDEGYECIANTAYPCTNACGYSGTAECNSSCELGTCVVFENCYSGGDEDCDGKADCDDSDCSALPICQPENCTNGVDDNGNNLVDCDDPECSTEPVCQPENCTNGVDDNDDKLVDCDDPDCATDVACHDFGTCSTQGAPGTGSQCTAWEQDNVPNSVFLIEDGCANSLYDQWAMGYDYSSAKALHLTGNHTWSEITLPVPGHGGSAMDVICLGQDQVFINYTNDNGGVFLHWNGSSFVELMKNQLDDLVVMGLWGTGADNLWFFGFDNSPIETLPGYMYHWNGSTLVKHDLPDFGDKVFRGYDLFGEQDDLYLAGFAADPDDWGNPATHKSMLLHWDGNSWAKVPGSDSIKEFTGIHGSSSCDIMAVGGKHTANGIVGATFQRNGNQWVTETHDSLSSIASVVKVSPYKFVLQAHEQFGASGQVWMGTHNGSSVVWSDDFIYKSEGSRFFSNGPTWKVPGTNVIMAAGDGGHGSGDPQGPGTYAFIFRATCQ